jgi:hypothetical protein
MMTNHSLTLTRSRRLLSLIVPLALAGACAAEADTSVDQSEARADRVAATITNMLAADGCSYPVTIDGVDYAPDAESVEAMRSRVPFGQWQAVVTYSLTGQTGEVQCGFGTTVQLPEISVRLIRIEN